MITDNDKARHFWITSDPASRQQHIPGLHPLAYGANWSELDKNERNKIRQLFNSQADD